MNKRYRFLVPAFAIVLASMVIFFVNIFLDANGSMISVRSGFGVIDQDTIVVGTANNIMVLRDNIVISTIQIRPIRRYVIGTSDDGHIRIYSPAGDIYTYAIGGELTAVEFDESRHKYAYVDGTRNQSIRRGDVSFVPSMLFGQMRIFRDVGQSRRECYEEPLLSYLPRMLAFLASISLFVTVSFTCIIYAKRSCRRNK